MNWIQGIQNAIDYIEENITDDINYETLARVACSSSFHFQRVFSIMCGVTVGEYIRMRRLTLAGIDLMDAKAKVLNVALKYGYDASESFSRAFTRFHGISPSQVKTNSSLNSYSRLSVKIDLIGGNEMKYKIKEMNEIVLTGYKKRFRGVPYGNERAKQEQELITATRAKQWLLIGASCDYSTDYCVVTNIDDDGYDFYVAYALDEWTRKEMFNPQVTGVDFIDQLGFETIVIPKQLCAVFETEKKKYPIEDYIDIRKRIVTEWLPSSGYVLADAPELVIMHWRPRGDWEKGRYVEICLPVEKGSV